MAKLDLKGDTPEEKLKHVEKILKHWQRKTRKAIVGIMPPIPVFNHTEYPMADGTVMVAVLPADGKISRIVILCKALVKDPVGFHCIINRAASTLSQAFEVKNGYLVADISREVEVGDVLTIKIYNPRDSEGNWIVKDISTSILYEISMKDSIKAQYMIENLERLLEKEDEGI